MPQCVIGMTNDEESRKQDHKRDYIGLHDWKVLGSYQTKEQAQAAETRLANEHDCHSYHGGRNPNKPNPKWIVYKFYHYGRRSN